KISHRRYLIEDISSKISHRRYLIEKGIPRKGSLRRRAARRWGDRAASEGRKKKEVWSGRSGQGCRPNPHGPLQDSDEALIRRVRLTGRPDARPEQDRVPLRSDGLVVAGLADQRSQVLEPLAGVGGELFQVDSQVGLGLREGFLEQGFELFLGAHQYGLRAISWTASSNSVRRRRSDAATPGLTSPSSRRAWMPASAAARISGQ